MALLIPILLALSVSSNDSGSVSHPTACCHVLDRAIRNRVSFPGDALYASEQSGLPHAGYWSQQQASETPNCRFTPTTAAEVAQAVRLLETRQCKFAIRGGGHTAWAGASNINETGLTIDLSALNQVVVSDSHAVAITGQNNIVSVGGGARWAEVYHVLDALNLGTAGGRVSNVGVGGLTTGGGKSFFQAQTGFACDNVANFELVTGCGEILQVNDASYPDLFRALKGGSNNFGIVTRFDLRTFPQGLMWGGQFVYPASALPALLQALYNFAEANDNVTSGNPEIIFARVTYSDSVGLASTVVSNTYTYTLPDAYPKMFDEMMSIQPILSNTSRIASLSSFTDELASFSPIGARNLFGTATFVNDADFFNFVMESSEAAFSGLFAANTSNLMVATVLQPLTKAMLAPGCEKNALGLCPAMGNLVILDLSVTWRDANDDAAIYKASKVLVDRVVDEAQRRGLFSEYIYLNYALEWQDPLASYGAQNLELLRRVSKRYDPLQTFQKLVPGGFKLWR